jgi:hypothetical protein
MNRLRRLLTAGLLLLSLALAGCAESIHTYEVPVVKQRLLGAIVIIPEKSVWFVKLMGKEEDVAAQKDRFTAFVKSLRFPAEGKEPVTWTVPDGWEYKPGKEMRFATFVLPDNLEVTVFRFGPEGGQVMANINRWREQLKLGKIDKEDLVRICKFEELEGNLKALMVDMESARSTPLREERPAAAPATDDDRPFDYKAPAGWTEKPDPGPIARAAFVVAADGKNAEVTITPLAGGGGALMANFNRWRQQVGLAEADEEQLAKDSRFIEVDGARVVLVELNGPAGKSILAAICPGGNRTWFVKMMGDAELVAKEKAAFESFLGTLKFRGGQ